MALTADSVYEQLMEHGRHVERERAWLLNFYIAILGGLIYGLLRSWTSAIKPTQPVVLV